MLVNDDFQILFELLEGRVQIAANARFEGALEGAGMARGDLAQQRDCRIAERILVRRTATIVRAGLLERAWTRLAGNFELTELYDVSFSERRKL